MNKGNLIKRTVLNKIYNVIKTTRTGWTTASDYRKKRTVRYYSWQDDEYDFDIMVDCRNDSNNNPFIAVRYMVDYQYVDKAEFIRMYRLCIREQERLEKLRLI